MARYAPDSFSSPSVSQSTPLEASAPPHANEALTGDALAGSIAPLAARAAVLLSVFSGLAVGALLMLALAGPAPERLQQDAELAALVRTMVLVKGIILLAALSLVTWRLSRPVARPQLAGYMSSLGLSAAAVAWMWSLNAIPVAALLFYGGLIGCFYTASRDPLLLRLEPASKRRPRQPA
ncbi:MAG: hypothetical protein VBE63_03450 [Lamprobacter sp.]|uniref:hypothetical protein n=1 Tax=Lamprobacter sp. TaxID=3100796 RepID=UPI002B262487|nr:hypothetical protein [Lamprobacter sp.]MEA3638980.1 hypothetical protein [Lamprobacter sp.]